ncbi:hypothetical protein HZ994_15905 [Akkermansiaceae bacterium]|nr:hypothetical protein HZ994_15905 [Akkermansiaceae bacterium]
MTETIKIHGGGLTGLSLAIALRNRGVPVILHEAGTYPRHRVCGEFISGISRQTIETLGISEPLEDALRHTDVAWFAGNRLLRENKLPEPALGISRHLLDNRLQQLAKGLGAEIRTLSRQHTEPGKPATVRTAGRRPTRGKWIGLKAHVRNIPTGAHLEMHSGPTGYLGITPVENGWTNVCGLFRADRSISASHRDLLPAYLRKNGNTALAAALENADWKPDSFTAIAGFALGLQPPTPGILALGDSHSIIPPFTGNGMTMAFQSAETALPHLVDYAKAKTNWPTTCERIAHALRSRFQKRLHAARFLHPLLFRPAARHFLKIAPINPILHLVR